MKLKFKTQAYQSAAVQSVVDCFNGQPPATLAAQKYRLDPGRAVKGSQMALGEDDSRNAFKNAELTLTDLQLLDNIKQVQRSQNMPVDDALAKTKVSRINLDVEMETGTGKTYCYIKSIFELNRRYGWSKFIIVVPSIAIREGVAKSLEITAEHFLETYQKKARFFIYNSKQLHHLESFSSDAGINVMVINVQAFAARGADNRRIYEVLDDFQSRRPIDVISANRPILILDEPQKMEGAQTLKSLEEFKALMVLRYSATHKTTHNKIHRLDALDAYNQKLVKKIAVRGIAVKGLAGTAGYLYLQSIEISSKKPPEARVEYEQKLAGGKIKRIVKKLSKGDNLYDLSNQLDQYRDGFVVSDINANTDTLSFTNGLELTVGDATGDVTEAALRRIQIREAIKAHFDKEQALFQQGVKVLTLYFIDEVAKYRDYTSADEKGDYARIFEEEYNQYLNEVLDLDETPYIKYLKGIPAEKTHSGYFSIDKKTKRLADPAVAARGENAGLSDDVDAYDLILKDKERLLSFAEPGAKTNEYPLAEVWSVYEGNTVSNGVFAGRTLAELVSEYPNEMLGAHVVAQGNKRFPLLIKLLDCANWLSLQVHPNDEQALQLEGPQFLGKTEAWQILKAQPDAQLIAGIKPNTSTEELNAAIGNEAILDLVEYHRVQTNDTVYMPAGTIHALGPGLLVYEVQQTSDLTYRVFDWKRAPINGRTLHIEKSIAVTNPRSQGQITHLRHVRDAATSLVQCPYFHLEMLSSPQERSTNAESFHALTVIDGDARISTRGNDVVLLHKFDTVLVSAVCGSYHLDGNFQILCSSVSH